MQMNTRSKSQSSDTRKNISDPIVTRKDENCSQGGDSDASIDSEQQQTMAAPDKEDMLSKLLEGQKQAKLASQKHNEELKKQFTDMKTLITANSNKFGEYVKSNDARIAKVDSSVDSMNNQIQDLQTQLKALQSQVNTVEKGLTNTNERVEQAEKDMGDATEELQSKSKAFQKVEMKLNAEEEEAKRCMVLLEGIPEKTKLKPREIAANLLNELGVNFVESDIRAAYRMGQLQNNQKKGRSIKIKFSASYIKPEIYKNIHKLKGNQGWEGVVISDVLSQQEQDQRRDLRCLAAYARSQDIEAKVKGDKLVIDEKVYRYEDIDELPHGLSMERAKIIAVSDGWAFQSHHAFLSNMHPSKFEVDNKVYKTNEHYFQSQCAAFHNDLTLEKKIIKAKDGYEAKRLAKKIKIVDEWEAEKPKVMAKGVAYKLDQNPVMKVKLCRMNGKLYEATNDMHFGCGLTLAQNKQIKSGNVPGKNILGDILEEFRDKELKQIMG